MGSCIKIFIFRPYGFDYLGFLTNARRGAMRSKTQWVIYRDLDWWPGPQKVQFEEITGYPEVVGLFLALLRRVLGRKNKVQNPSLSYEHTYFLLWTLTSILSFFQKKIVFLLENLTTQIARLFNDVLILQTSQCHK